MLNMFIYLHWFFNIPVYKHKYNNVASGQFVTFLEGLYRAVHFAIYWLCVLVKSCPAIYCYNDGRTRLTLFVESYKPSGWRNVKRAYSDNPPASQIFGNPDGCDLYNDPFVLYFRGVPTELPQGKIALKYSRRRQYWKSC